MFAARSDDQLTQSTAVKVMTGFELRKLLQKQALWPIVSHANQTRLIVWLRLPEQQVIHKALVPNEKQLSAEAGEELLKFEVGTTRHR
jgi:hypothetical protein